MQLDVTDGWDCNVVHNVNEVLARFGLGCGVDFDDLMLKYTTA